MKTILSVCSARPNFVKLAAIHHAFQESGFSKQWKHVIVHTGQHYDPLFSDIFFEQLSIPMPDCNLGIHGGSREQVITDTAVAIDPVLKKYTPDIVLVYGDVNGAVGAARAAKKLGIKLGHIEAGLRSFDMTMPEEVNRLEIDGLADILFVSEQSGMENLLRENIKGQREFVGNTMIDTLLRMLPYIEKESLPQYAKKPFAIATLHRPSNVDTKEVLVNNLFFLGKVAEHCSVILPLHHRAKSSLTTFGLTEEIPAGVHIVDPLGYISFLKLVKESAFIITDSGGIQEEATLLKKRCFTLRKNTERPSTIESGSNILIDIENSRDIDIVCKFATDPAQVLDIKIPALWDGKTGKRIMLTLDTFLQQL